MKKGNKINCTIVFILLTALLSGAFIAATGTGAVKIPVKEILQIVFLGAETDNRSILMDIRLPRVLLAIVLGGGLAAIGAVMQGIFRNPLVDSYTLGMSSGAALGAVLSIVTGINFNMFGLSTTGVFAFIGAVCTLFFVYGLSYRKSRLPMNSLLLAGVATSYFLSSVISFMMILNRNKIEHIVFWTMGSLSTATWTKAVIAAVIIIPGIAFLMLFSRELNIITLGDESAQSLGINTGRLKSILLFVCAAMVGCVVSTGGTIGFLGLVAPHIIRLVCGSDNRILIPYSALAGAVILLISDTIGRVLIPPAEIPVGIMTSIMGGPFFIFLLRRNMGVKQ